MTNLQWLGLSSNQLTGVIPPEIGNLTSLNSLYLGWNQLTGSIPSEIGNLTNLTKLHLPSNQLTGEIPSEIGNLTSLYRLQLYSNQFSSEIPETICNLTNLDWSSGGVNQFDSYIYNNKLCPQYPECIEEYVGEQNISECLLSTTDNLFPTIYYLSHPYPNPFNPSTTITFSIPQLDMVSLKVYDITGKLVTMLINEQLNIGYYSVDWDGTYLSSGMYFARMESGDYIATQKLLLVK